MLLSLTAALAFYYLRWTAMPEAYLIPVKGAGVALLALYAFMRHSSPDARLLTWALGAACLGDMALEFDHRIGGMLFFLFHVLAMGVFLRNRRPELKGLDSWVAGLTLILTPVIAWMLPTDREAAWEVGFYALALGGMAASAWASNFPRYRVGAGAMLFLASDLLIFAEMGPLQGHFLPQYMVWPTYYLGMFLITTGVIQTLRKRDPELRVVK
ncbi:lysoplasmalogenase [Alteraurantiacibacter aquimixticola]|uniref:lysoplasmalogenase n=1 Tax=Alteraurantiacibacter aquimixticola TaxID=2489173 RepID=UPI001FE9E28E|nr:lysoplasmalogenase [Alteraurantiacibacter aquimixticola]